MGQVVGKKIKFSARIAPMRMYEFLRTVMSVLVSMSKMMELVNSATAMPISKLPGYKAKTMAVYKNSGKCVW